MAKRSKSSTGKVGGGGGGGGVSRQSVPKVLWNEGVGALKDLAGKPAIVAMAEYRSAQQRPRTNDGSRTGGNAQGSSNKPARSVMTARAQGTMRARSRSLLRNNLPIQAMVRRKCEHIVGDGFTFTIETDDAAWNTQAQVLLTDWADEIELWRTTQWAVRAFEADGDGAVMKIRNAAGRCSLQAIPADLVVTPDKNGNPLVDDNGTIVMLVDGGMISAGVETDIDGRVVAYHVAEWGDEAALRTQVEKTGKEQRTAGAVWAGGVGMWGLGPVKRIPAERMMFLTPETLGNPGQHRGEPGLQAAIPLAELVYLWLEDVLVAADMATKFGLIIAAANPALEKASDDVSLQAQAVEMAVDVAGGADPEIVLETGLVKYVRNVGAVHQIKPEFPTVNTPEFVAAVLQMIGAGMGLPAMLATFDMKGTTASNGKMIMAMAYRGFETPMKVLADRLWKPSARFRLATAIANSELPTPTDKDWAKKIRIGTPYAPVMDLNNEGKAWDYLVKNNLATHHDACMQLGSGTGNEVAAKRKQEIDRDRKLNITPAETPGAKRPGESSAGAGADTNTNADASTTQA